MASRGETIADGTGKLTRRLFLTASCGLLLPRLGWCASVPEPVLAWSLRRTRRAPGDSKPADRGTIIAATGRLRWAGDEGQAEFPRLDGYSVWIEEELKAPLALSGEATLIAWVALEAFPVNTASVIEWGDKSEGVSLGIDRLGFSLLEVRSEGHTTQAKAPTPLDRARWVHLAATVSRRGALMLYIDGKEQARAEFTSSRPALAEIKHVYLGRAQECPIVANIFPTGVLNGLLRDVRIYKQCLAADEIHQLAREFEPSAAPLAVSRTWFEQDAQRPRYHTMPPRAWTNEPHGLVHWHGEYHLFYQKNPNGPYWGHIHWGHMTSPDLLHWTEQPIALTPEAGPDSEGCWSGSAIVVDDRIHLIYTGGDGHQASICMATSQDGIRFSKHAGNPIIQAPPAGLGVKEFRDPFIWKQGPEYRMIIGSGVEGVGGTALLYRSRDLTSWQFLKPLLIGSKQDSGTFWEMPVFVKFGTYHVLIVCEVPGRASYWVGTWEDDTFRTVSASPRRLDLLNHFLSPTPYTDESGRVTTIGIVPDSRDAREAWQAGWAHLYGLPRELTLDEQMNLRQQVYAGVQERFATLEPAGAVLSVSPEWRDLCVAGTCLRVSATFDRGQSHAIEIALRRAPANQEITVLRYEWDAEQLSFDRTRSSLNAQVVRNAEHASYTPLHASRIALDIYLDQSVVEVFVDDRSCFSSRIYPVLPESVGVSARSEGGTASVLVLSADMLIDSSSR